MWMIVIDGQKTGPYSPEQITGLISSGKVTLSSMVWRDGMPEWLPLGGTELSALVGPPLPTITKSVAPPLEDKSKAAGGQLLKGCLGCSGAAIILAIMVAIFSDSATDSRPASIASAAPAASSRPSINTSVSPPTVPTYALNETFRLGAFSYTITGREARHVLGTRFSSTRPEEGAVFVLVSYQIENLQNETARALSSDFALIDYQGRKFDSSSKANTALLMAGETRDFIISELQPGIKKRAIQAFEIPLDAAQRAGLRVAIPEKGFGTQRRAQVPLN